MTKAQLEALRDAKQNEMKALVERSTESDKEMTETELATVHTLKEEIRGFDNKIEAINILQAEMKKAADPVAKDSDTQAELRANFKDYLTGNITEKEYNTRAQVVGTAAKGGTTVPDDFFRELQEKIKEYGVISGKCRHITTQDHGALTIPTIDDTANAGVWTDEMGAINPEDFATDKLEMNAYKVTTAISVSTELLEDAFFNVESYIAQAMGERIARTTEKSFIVGTGTKQPSGIVGDAGTVNVVTKTVGKADSKDLMGMIHKLDPSQRAGSEFLVSDAMLEELLLEVDANGRPLLQLAQNATQANDVQYTIAGYPVSVNYELDDTIAADKVVALFGNLNNYMIRDIRSLTVKRDDYTGMSTDSVSFYATMRLDGKVVNMNKCFAKLTVKKA